MLQSLQHRPAIAQLPAELGQGDGLTLLRQMVEQFLLLGRGGAVPCRHDLTEGDQPAGPALQAWGLAPLA